MARITAATMAEIINSDCEERRHFWACGLVKETLDLWRTPENYELLSPEAKTIVDHYLKEATVPAKRTKRRAHG